MNMQASISSSCDILNDWRATVGTSKRASAIAVQRALQSKKARVELIEKVGPRTDSPVEAYLSVTYNSQTAQVRFADANRETVHPPQGLILYNMLNRMIGPRQ